MRRRSADRCCAGEPAEAAGGLSRPGESDSHYRTKQSKRERRQASRWAAQALRGFEQGISRTDAHGESADHAPGSGQGSRHVERCVCRCRTRSDGADWRRRVAGAFHPGQCGGGAERGRSGGYARAINRCAFFADSGHAHYVYIRSAVNACNVGDAIYPDNVDRNDEPSDCESVNARFAVAWWPVGACPRGHNGDVARRAIKCRRGSCRGGYARDGERPRGEKGQCDRPEGSGSLSSRTARTVSPADRIVLLGDRESTVTRQTMAH